MSHKVERQEKVGEINGKQWKTHWDDEEKLLMKFEVILVNFAGGVSDDIFIKVKLDWLCRCTKVMINENKLIADYFFYHFLFNENFYK